MKTPYLSGAGRLRGFAKNKSGFSPDHFFIASMGVRLVQGSLGQIMVVEQDKS